MSHMTLPFTLEERALGTDWIGGWVDPTAGLDAVETKLLLMPEIEPSIPRPPSP
jgi:hypothetical protein